MTVLSIEDFGIIFTLSSPAYLWLGWLTKNHLNLNDCMIVIKTKLNLEC